MFTAKNAPSPSAPPRAARTRMTGVTMIELLVVIVIVAILMGIAMPSYKNITTSYRVSGEVNGLLGDMQFTRAEAIKEGQAVTICVSANGTSCDNTTAWQNGWIVFAGTPSAATPTVLRLQAGFANSDTFADATSQTSAITYGREGLISGRYSAGNALTSGSDTFIALHDPTANLYYTRCLQITSVGALQVTQNSVNGSCT